MSIRPKDQKCVVCKRMFSRGRGFDVHMQMHSRNGGATPNPPDVILALATIKNGGFQLRKALAMERAEHVEKIAFIDSQIAMLEAVGRAISEPKAEIATEVEVSPQTAPLSAS